MDNDGHNWFRAGFSMFVALAHAQTVPASEVPTWLSTMLLSKEGILARFKCPVTREIEWQRSSSNEFTWASSRTSDQWNSVGHSGS